MTTYLKIHFTVFVFVTIVFTKLSFGLPVRSFMLMALAGILFVFYTNLVLDFVKRQYGILLMLLAMGVLGGLLSLQNDVSIFFVFNKFNQVILQVILTMACTYLMCEIAGPRFVVYVLLCVFTLTGVVAILQFLQVDFFWELRIQMARFMNDDQRFLGLLIRKDRAIGLSATTMNLAYQTISFLIACYLLAKARLMNARLFNIIAALLLVVAIVSGVRSLAFGVLVTILIFNLRENLNKQSFVLILLMLAVGLMVVIVGIESRLTSVSDGSAIARLVLIKYGSLLIAEKPFGHGWGFDTVEHSWAYWSYLIDFKNSNAVRSYGLHNYFVGFLVEYGVIGLFLILLAALANTAKFVEFLILFGGYLINSFFHNGGPFNGAIYFWTSFAIFSYLLDKGQIRLSLASNSAHHRIQHGCHRVCGTDRDRNDN